VDIHSTLFGLLPTPSPSSGSTLTEKGRKKEMEENVNERTDAYVPLSEPEKVEIGRARAEERAAERVRRREEMQRELRYMMLKLTPAELHHLGEVFLQTSQLAQLGDGQYEKHVTWVTTFLAEKSR
jgi:hypothetical protein